MDEAFFALLPLAIIIIGILLLTGTFSFFKKLVIKAFGDIMLIVIKKCLIVLLVLAFSAWGLSWLFVPLSNSPTLNTFLAFFQPKDNLDQLPAPVKPTNKRFVTQGPEGKISHTRLKPYESLDITGSDIKGADVIVMIDGNIIELAMGVTSPCNNTVKCTEKNGNFIRIQSEYNTLKIKTVYAHMMKIHEGLLSKVNDALLNAKLPALKTGERMSIPLGLVEVKSGEILGKVGNTGEVIGINSGDGTHLHFGILIENNKELQKEIVIAMAGKYKVSKEICKNEFYKPPASCL